MSGWVSKKALRFNNYLIIIRSYRKSPEHTSSLAPCDFPHETRVAHRK